MSIPAIDPPLSPGGLGGYPPGTSFDGLTGAIDDTAGSGLVIPLGQVDDSNVHWRITDLIGWDSADLQEQAEAKTGSDGAWDAPNYYGARTVEIKGLIKAPTVEALEAAKYRLTQAVPPRRLVTLRLDETTPKQLQVRRSGRPMVGDLTDVLAEFDVSLLAPDPRKYAVDAVSADLTIAELAPGLAPPWTPPILLPDRPPGSDFAILINTGTYESPPLIRINGPGRDLEIVNSTTGLFLGYDLELAASDFLLIDVAAGVALLNGTAVRAPITGSTVTGLFMAVPGANEYHLSGTATDPILVAGATVQFNPAWD